MNSIYRNGSMWEEITSRVQREKQFWHEITESGKRYEGAESRFKNLRTENTVYLYQCVEATGWPCISKFGTEINEAAYLVARASIQHPQKMKYFLAKLSASVDKQESNPAHLAALADCVKYYEGKPQICGLFLEWALSGELYANVVCVDQANIKRKELGFPSIQEAVQAHLKELQSNPGGKPKDIAAHNKMHREWAKAAGW